MYTIYALVDPRDNTVRYVGMTDDMYERFAQHIRCDGSNPTKDGWIRELRKANRMVGMITLQEVEGLELAKKREAYWIMHYHQLGLHLMNLIIPVDHESKFVIQLPEREACLKARPHMTIDEQRELVAALYESGLTRIMIQAKVGRYVSPEIVRTVLDECTAVKPLPSRIIDGAFHGDTVKLARVQNLLREKKSQQDIVSAVWQAQPSTRAFNTAVSEYREMLAYLVSLSQSDKQEG